MKDVATVSFAQRGRFIRVPEGRPGSQFYGGSGTWFVLQVGSDGGHGLRLCERTPAGSVNAVATGRVFGFCSSGTSPFCFKALTLGVWIATRATSLMLQPTVP